MPKNYPLEVEKEILDLVYKQEVQHQLELQDAINEYLHSLQNTQEDEKTQKKIQDIVDMEHQLKLQNITDQYASDLQDIECRQKNQKNEEIQKKIRDITNKQKIQHHLKLQDMLRVYV